MAETATTMGLSAPSNFMMPRLRSDIVNTAAPDPLEVKDVSIRLAKTALIDALNFSKNPDQAIGNGATGVLGLLRYW